MSKFQKIHNSLNFFEGTAAVFAFAGIIVLSTLTVVGLNPKVNTSENTTKNVAGAVDELQSLNITNLYKRSRHEVAFENNIVNRNATFNINVKSINEGEEILDLAQIKNPNENLIKVNLESIVAGSLGDDLVVQILDGEKVYEVYSLGNSKNTSFTVEGGAEKTLQIKYIASQNINFGFKLTLNLEY